MSASKGEQLHIPEEWRQAAYKIRELGEKKVLVLGATDRGKSTFCAYLAWHLLQAGQKPAYIDADVGQKDIGPPSTITLGYPQPDKPLQTLEPTAMYFVGAVSPVGHLLPMVVGTRQLMERTATTSVIINTSGLVEGVGEILMTYQIDSLRPDIIVALKTGRELSSILKAHAHYPILRLRPSPGARSKTLEQRRLNREAAFQRYFSNALDFELALDDLIVQRLPPSHVHPDWHRTLTPNRLCALADGNQSVLGLGIIRGYQKNRRRLWLTTPVSPGECKILQLGNVRLELAIP